jgi:hypothetical protein
MRSELFRRGLGNLVDGRNHSGAVSPLVTKRDGEDLDLLSQSVRDHYCCPDDFLDFALSGDLSSRESYFRFGPETLGYGRSWAGGRSDRAESSVHDALLDTVIQDSKLRLPFDPTEVIDNLRLERYPHRGLGRHENNLKKIYYWLRPFTNQSLRKQIQRFHARNWRKAPFPRWPVDTTVENICERILLLSLKAKGVERIPFVWFWPRGAKGCVLMTHDVETAAGRDFCKELLDLDDSFGVKGSFQIVPEGRYSVPGEFLDEIRNRGCEIAVQDLNHDGRLFDDRQEFVRRVGLIHQYAAEYGARGFRAAMLYRKVEWYDMLQVSFDMSIPNVAHLDPQRGGCCTVMPYFIGKILELPVTTVQDYMLFHLLNERSIALWKDQVELILEKNGLASFIVHPDYIRDHDTKPVYEELLKYLRGLGNKTPIWYALPSEIDAWWRARSQMLVVKDGDSWRIEGEGAERAVLAFAKDVDGKLVYEVEHVPSAELCACQ